MSFIINPRLFYIIISLQKSKKIKINNYTHQRCKEGTGQPTTVPSKHKIKESIFTRNTLSENDITYSRTVPLPMLTHRDDKNCPYLTFCEAHSEFRISNSELSFNLPCKLKL